jgi:periplasmic divalent cation tolerance protein
MGYCILLTTCPNVEEAGRLAAGLMEKKLAACVQLSPITSYYTWESQVRIDPEIRLLIKTKTRLYGNVEQYIREQHSYKVPQIVQVEIKDGSNEYLGWIDENTTKLKGNDENKSNCGKRPDR